MKHSTSSKHEGPHCHSRILDGLPLEPLPGGHRVLRGTSQHLRTSSLYSVSCLAWRPKACALEHGKVPHDSVDPGRILAARPGGSLPSIPSWWPRGSRAAMGFVPFVSLQTAGPNSIAVVCLASRNREHQGLGTAFSPEYSKSNQQGAQRAGFFGDARVLVVALATDARNRPLVSGFT